MNSKDPNFDWHVNGLYVALGPGNEVYTDTAGTTAHGARAALLAHMNKPWSRLQEMGYSIQAYTQPAPSTVDQLPEVVLAELPANAMNFIDRANDALLKAVARNNMLQVKFKVGTPEWHDCESISDHLHDALAALGQ